MNPELEVLRFLTERGFEHTPRSRATSPTRAGRSRRRSRPCRSSCPRRATAGSSRSTRSMRGEPDWLPEHARRLGEVTALPAQRARVRSDRSALRARGSEHRGARAPVGVDRRGDRARLHRPARDRGARARPRPRRGGARPSAPAHEHRPRRSRDPDARRLPPRPGALDERGRLADPRLRGRAGAFGRRAAPEDVSAPRRRGHASLVRLRRVGGEDPARASIRPRAGRIAAAREFLDGYLETADPALLPSSRDQVERLLTVFELEKAVYELRYELHNRPDWVAIPVAGILRMLEQS